MTVGAFSISGAMARPPERRPKRAGTMTGIVAESDSAKFNRLVLPLIDDVLTLACYLARNRADAEDATQETFLRAIRYIGTFSGTSAKPWLFAILRNVLASRGRSRFVPIPEGEEDHTLAAPLWTEAEAGPEAALEQKDAARHLQALVERLPDAYREVVVLREFGDLSYREIADMTKLPIGTVMSRLARAREQLRTSWLAGRTRTNDQ
jgi:RNA polymerase sigma-70 factor (ECF subfamily)